MSKVLFRARTRFASNQAGNVGILFAFTAIPLLGLLGGAVDVTRHHRYKAEILGAMDAAAVALAKRGAASEDEANAFVNDFIATMRAREIKDGMLHLGGFTAVKLDGGWRVESDGSMDTAFMPLVGIRDMPLDLSTEVRTSSRNYEIALALDNTGSMREHGRMEALQDAANGLIDDLYSEPGADERVKMALVPFVTAVNIKTKDVFQDSWIQPSVDPDLDMGFKSEDGEPVDRLELFDDMNVEWKGCVEARRTGDEDDTLPVDAASRWVPYLWPDEPDDRGYGNSYLRDSGSGGDWNRISHIDKYELGAGRQPTNTTSKGPNAACPRAVVELTNDRDRMHEEIDLMKPHNRTGGNHSGTNVAQGLIWGWRVLSPEEPYSQGVSYGDPDAQKVLVLLSDGRNQVVQNWDEDRVTQSDYTSYDYLAANRMGSKTNYRTAEKTIDAKVSRICESIKAKGIRLYTILFEVDFDETQDIFRACASKDDDGKPLYYYVPSGEALEQAFNEIGKDMTEIFISR